MAEDQDRAQRHKMGNLMSACRIFNGALRSGDYNLLVPDMEKKAVDLYKEMIERSQEWEENDAKEERIKDAIQTIEYAKNELSCIGIKSKTKIRPWHEETNIKKVLIVDDEKEIWEPVWKFIMGEEKIEVAMNGDEALSKIKGSGQYDLIILDLNLSEGQENGIEILQRIKHMHFDMPVVMMTAYDHAELTKICLRYGAYSYFVKELEHDRDSVEYYKYIKKLICEIPVYNDGVREIWREFEKLEPQIDFIDSKYNTQIGALFRKAYYLLSMDDEHFIPSKLLIPLSKRLELSSTVLKISPNRNDKSLKYSGVVYNALLTLDQIFIAKVLMDNEGYDYNGAFNELFQKKNQNGNYPSLRDRANRVGYGNEISALLKPQVQKVRHVAVNSLSRNEAIDCLFELLRLMKKLIGKTQENNSLSKPQFEPEVIDLKQYKRIKKAEKNNHKVISRNGAEYFSQGMMKKYNNNYLNENNLKENLHQILFIDDEGKRSDWYLPLEKLAKIKGYRLTCFVAYDEEKVNIDDYEIVLLDLVFNGNYEKGIEYLRKIRDKDISIPIIMLTADNSAYYARKCLLNGADDYFTKQPFDNELNYFGYFERIIDFYINQIKTKKRRAWWNLLKKTKNLNLQIESCALEKIRNFYIPEIDKKNFEKIENELRTFHMGEGYFYYLLEINKEKTIDFWRTKRLLSQNGSFIPDIYISLGRFVEYLVNIISVTQNIEPGLNNVGALINGLKMPDFLRNFLKKLWEARIRSKLLALYEIDVENTIQNLENIMSRVSFSNIAKENEIKKEEDDYLSQFQIGQKVQGKVLNKKKKNANVEIEFPLAKGIVDSNMDIKKGEKYIFSIKEVDIENGIIKLELPNISSDNRCSSDCR